MAGNAAQWVQDCFHGDYRGAPADGSAWVGGDCGRRMVRGGAWNLAPHILRSASREPVAAGNRYNILGFRVARSLEP